MFEIAVEKEGDRPSTFRMSVWNRQWRSGRGAIRCRSGQGDSHERGEGDMRDAENGEKGDKPGKHLPRGWIRCWHGGSLLRLTWARLDRSRPCGENGDVIDR